MNHSSFTKRWDRLRTAITHTFDSRHFSLADIFFFWIGRVGEKSLAIYIYIHTCLCVCVCVCVKQRRQVSIFLYQSIDPLPFKGLSIIGELIPPPPCPKARQAMSDDDAVAPVSTAAVVAEVGDLLPWHARTNAS